jgi:hypothetical protein
MHVKIYKLNYLQYIVVKVYLIAGEQLMKYEKSMLLETIGDTPENRILDFLIEGKGIGYSKKDIADGCDLSRPTIYKMLPGMLKEQLVAKTRKIGRIELYEVNSESEKVGRLLKLEALLLKESMPMEAKSMVAVCCKACHRPM